MKIYVFLFLIEIIACSSISKEFVENNDQFAIDLYRDLEKNHNRNVLSSGFSIRTLLGLTYQGAKGGTAKQMKEVLRFPQSDQKFLDETRDMLSNLDNIKSMLTISNQMYLGKNFKIEPKFLKTATEVFRADVKNVDFSKVAETVQEINSWVSKHTHGKVVDVMTSDQISDDTRMVLLNALYFNGKFQYPFPIENTKKRPFYLSKNMTVSVETMKLTQTFSAFRSEKDKYTILVLPYANTDERGSITIVFPDDIDGLEQLTQKLTDVVAERLKDIEKKFVTVYLPKFKLHATVDLKENLKNMGIRDLFKSADLSGITKEDLVVDGITQKLTLEVHENGTEAAVATNQIFITKSAKRPIIYRIDRPFIFGVSYDDVCIFGGKVMNPLEEEA